MKKHIRIILALGMSGILLSGCSANRASFSGDIKDESAVVEESSAVGAGAAEPTPAPNFAEPPKPVSDERSSPDSLLSKRLIYFDYDKSLVKDEYLPIIDAHIDYLVRNPDRGVLLAGNTDNRGSNEYNLALGQRRADAVRDLMSAAGIPAAQLEAISFGEEFPAELGDNEAAWAANRRVEIRYTDE